MKTILKSTMVVVFMLISHISFSQTTQTEKTDTAKIKLKLTQYLLSCQSMYYTILKEKDFQSQAYLANIGTDYYNKAYKEWISLQDLGNGTISEDLRKTISTILQGYEKVFRETEKLNDPMNALLLQFTEAMLKKTVLPGLWDKK